MKQFVEIDVLDVLDQMDDAPGFDLAAATRRYFGG